MTRIPLDHDLLNRLNNLSEPLELVDASGTVLGWVQLAVDEYQGEWAPSPAEEELLNDEPLDEARFTPEELVEHLKQLSCTSPAGLPDDIDHGGKGWPQVGP